MRPIVKLALVGALGAVCFSAGHLVAQEGAGGMPGWMQTTKEHEALKKNVGEWDVAMKYWMAPGAPPMDMQGQAKMKLILGGKYVRQDFSGNFGGMPFAGIGISGFDTVDKKHTSLWLDNMSPVMMTSIGEEKDGKLEYKSKGVNQMSGKKQDERQVLVWDGDDKFMMTFYAPGPDGKESKSMELTYTRKKKAAEKTPETPKTPDAPK